jgi:hypothetical protein
METNPKIDKTSYEGIEKISENFYKLVIEAEQEALRHAIVANTIVINENMCEVKPAWFRGQYNARQLPPMICGMNVYFTKNELPDNYSFAVFEGPPNRLAEFESIGMEPDELRKAAELYRKVKEIL